MESFSPPIIKEGKKNLSGFIFSAIACNGISFRIYCIFLFTKSLQIITFKN